MNPRKMQYKSKRNSKRKQLKKEHILMISMVGIATIIMLAYSIHIYNDKNYNYIKSKLGKDLIYTYFYDDKNDYIKDVPYVNMNAPHIEEVNRRIKVFSDKYTVLNRSIITYDYEISGQVLSLVIKAVSYETNYASEAEFLSFNINVETQEVYDDDTLLAIYNIDKNFVKDKIKRQLQEYHSEIIKENYYTIQQCNFECFLKWRDIDNYLDGTSYYIKQGQLYVYKPFVFASIFGEEEYFKDNHFEFLIIEQPRTE